MVRIDDEFETRLAWGGGRSKKSKNKQMAAKGPKAKFCGFEAYGLEGPGYGLWFTISNGFIAIYDMFTIE